LTFVGKETGVDGCNYGDDCYDSLSLEIYRTKANPGEIGKNDKFYLIQSISLTDKSQIDSLHFIDNIPDDSLGISPYDTIMTIDTSKIGRDSTGVLTGVRVGAPTYVGNTAPAGTNVDIFITPIADSEFVYKTSYIMTYFDTLINAESDSSRSLHIFRNHSTDSMYNIGLPPLPGGKSHLTRKLYKSYSYVLQIDRDTMLLKEKVITVDYSAMLPIASGAHLELYLFPALEIRNMINEGKLVYIKPDFEFKPGTKSNKWNKVITYYIKYLTPDTSAGTPSSYPDTINTYYKLIAEIKGSDSVFIDTITWDSTQRGKPYYKSAAPYNLDNITSFEDKLWGSVGSVVYRSYLDTGSIWGSFRNIVLDEDDGDAVTAIVPMRNYTRVFKNYSQYIIYGGTAYEYESGRDILSQP